LLLSTFQIGAAESLALPTGLITAVFLTRTLGPASYGLFTLAASLVSWLQWTLAAIFSRLTVRLVAGANDPRSAAAYMLRVIVATGAVASLGLVALAPSIAGAFGEPSMTLYLRLYAADVLLFATAQGFLAYRVGTGQFKRKAAGAATRWIVRLIAIVTLVGLGYGIPGAILGNMCATVAELVVKGFGDWELLWIPGRVARRAAALEGFPIALSSISMKLFERLDLVLLKTLGADAAEAGAYGAAQNCTFFGSVLATSMAPQLLARLTRSIKDKDPVQARADARSMLGLVAALLPAIGLASYLSPWASNLIFGSAYTQTGPVLAVLVWAVYGMVWSSVSQAILIAHQRSSFIAMVSVLTLALSAGLNLYLIPRHGMVGAAWATTSAALFQALVCAVPVLRIFWR
jgi:O-antigen/teichoic acid export membrane protein